VSLGERARARCESQRVLPQLRKLPHHAIELGFARVALSILLQLAPKVRRQPGPVPARLISTEQVDECRLCFQQEPLIVHDADHPAITTRQCGGVAQLSQPCLARRYDHVRFDRQDGQRLRIPLQNVASA